MRETRETKQHSYAPPPRMQCVCYPSTIYTGHALRHLSICAAVPIAHRISIELHGQSWIVRVTRSLLLFLGYRFSVRMYVRSKHNGEFGAAAVPYTFCFVLVEINLKKKISILLFWYKYGIRLYSMRCDALNDRTTRDLFARVGTQRHTRVHSRTSSTGARDSDADKELRTGIQKTCMRASMRDLSFSRSLSVTDGRGRLGLI